MSAKIIKRIKTWKHRISQKKEKTDKNKSKSDKTVKSKIQISRIRFFTKIVKKLKNKFFVINKITN